MYSQYYNLEEVVEGEIRYAVKDAIDANVIWIVTQYEIGVLVIADANEPYYVKQFQFHRNDINNNLFEG